MNEYEITSFTTKRVTLLVVATCKSHAEHIARDCGYGVLESKRVYEGVNTPEGLYSVR